MQNDYIYKVGDLVKTNRTKKCLYYKKYYSIFDTSKSGKSIWISNNKTNLRKCKCKICEKLQFVNNKKICININEITLYKTKEEMIRFKKINKILKNK